MSETTMVLSGDVVVADLKCQSSCVLKSSILSSFQVKGEMFTSVPRSLSLL